MVASVPSVPLVPIVLAVICLTVTGTIQADDVVIAKPKQGRGTVRLTGEIKDYTGKQLTLRRFGDREEVIDASRILDIQATLTPFHRSADETFVRRNFGEAWKKYRRAADEELRPWMHRRILAQSIWCLRLTDRTEQAIDAFLQLYRDDPSTQFFHVMPISWVATAPPSALERKARSMIAEGELPVARLIGASWLLPTSHRAAAIATLRSLLTAEDSRVAFWAEAQLWRQETASASAEAVDRWHSRWLRMPAKIQPGPAFVLGQAFSQLQRHEDAALLYLRAPILQPLDRELATQAIQAAGKEYEPIKQIDANVDPQPERLAPNAVQSPQEEFVTGLRERRLFELAEKYCEGQLADSQATPSGREILTVELIRTFAEHAANSAPDRRERLWRLADETGARFVRNQPGHSHSHVIKTQQVLTVLARGELEFLESEVAADPNVAVIAARESIRRAAKLLESLAAELTAAIPLRNRKDISSDELTAGEMTSLLNNVRYHQTRAARFQALTYPDKSPDRIAALTQAVTYLATPLLELPAGEPLAMKMRLETAICQRMLHDDEAARESFEMLDAAGVAPDVRLSARAEQIRWHLSSGKIEEALNLLKLGREIEGVGSPELDFAQLEASVAQWLTAADAKQTENFNRFRDQAIQSVKFVEQTHGPYWGRRAEIVLVSAAGTRSGGSLEILRRAADDFYLKGQINEALATYDKAAAAARQASDWHSFFEMAYKAALVQQQQLRHIDAARRFRELSLAQQTHSQAASAHLLAVFNEAQAWKADVTRRDQYLTRLKEHIATWPYSATSNAARLWLGRLYENEQSWQLAVEAYRAVNRNSEYSIEAAQGADRCRKSRERRVESREPEKSGELKVESREPEKSGERRVESRSKAESRVPE